MNTTERGKIPGRSRRIGWIGAALLGCMVAGGGVWWSSPGNTAHRYRRMSIPELQRTLAQNPADALAARTLALRLPKEGDSEATDAALLNAQTLNPSDPEVAAALGEFRMAKGRYVEAFQILKSVAGRFPKSTRGRAALGKFYLDKASYLHAATEYEAVVALDKNLDDAWYSLAVCYLEMQQSAKAQGAIDTALRLHPNEPRYLALKGNVDIALGNVDAALEETCRAAQLAPHDAQIASTLTNLLLAQHRTTADLDLAEQTLARLEQLHPDYPQLSFQHGELERLRQRWLPAAHYLERARATNPGQDAVYFALSQVYRRLNRYQEADRMIQIFQRRQRLHMQMDAVRFAMSSHPNSADLYAQLAKLQFQLGDRNSAFGSLQAGLTINPENARLMQMFREQSAPATEPGP